MTFLISLAFLMPEDAVGQPYRVVEYSKKGDGIPEPLGGLEGDPVRGRAIVAGREGNCLACHHAPIPEEQFHGNLGPALDGVGDRYSEAQLRLRLVAPQVLNPDTVMPAFHRVDGLKRVATKHRNRPILDAQTIEDVIAYLKTLRK